MIIVDATVVNVAVPVIIKDLGIGLTTAEWITDIYTIVFAAFLVTLGRVGDVFGRRMLFVWGIVVFLAGSVLSGLAPSGGALVGARFVQGVGAAAILPATLAIVNATFQGRSRAVAFGI